MSKMYEALQYASTQQELENTKRVAPPVFPKQKLENKANVFLPMLRTLPKSLPSVAVDVPGPSMESEMLQLDQSISTLLPDPHKNILQFIGSHQGVGTSTILREFGKVLAKQYGKSILLIDMDFRHPSSQHHAFGIHPKEPLDSLMKNGGSIDSVISQVQQSRIYLSLLAANKNSNSNASMHVSDELIWEPIRKQFDLILIDSPPISTSVDGLTLSSTVDGVIVVVEAEKTRSPVVLTLKNRILESGGNILGVAFNKQRHYIPDWAYRLL